MASFSHSYDVRGNLKALTELGATKTYSYDQIERLTAEARQAANGTSTPAESYSYDGEGNRVTSQSEGGPAQTYATDAANRVTDDGVNTYTWTARTLWQDCLRFRCPHGSHAPHAEIWRAGADVLGGAVWRPEPGSRRGSPPHKPAIATLKPRVRA